MLRPRPLAGGGVAWKHDLAVQHIINTSNWKVPIYFAVTVPHEIWRPYEDYLEMQGMVRRLVPRKDKGQLNGFMVARNFDHIFRFRGVLTEDGEIDDSVYKNEEVRAMFMNFAVAAFQLGQMLSGAGDYEEALERFELSQKLEPGFEWPKRYLGLFHLQAGRPDRAVAHYEEMIREDPGEGEYWIRLAGVYEAQGMLPEALQKCKQGIEAAPDFRDLYGYGFRIAALLGDSASAKGLVVRWLAIRPDDGEFRSILGNIDEILKNEFGLGGGGESPAEKGER
jgi:tetratricopeptide (TPR) repeat protein